jgi:hypothetical protein
VFDLRQLGPDGLDRLDVILVDEQHFRAAMVDDVDEIGGRESVVDWDEHGADLRDCVIAFQVGGNVLRDIGEPVAGLDAELLQPARPSVDAVEELLIRASFA